MLTSLSLYISVIQCCPNSEQDLLLFYYRFSLNANPLGIWHPSSDQILFMHTLKTRTQFTILQKHQQKI